GRGLQLDLISFTIDYRAGHRSASNGHSLRFAGGVTEIEFSPKTGCALPPTCYNSCVSCDPLSPTSQRQKGMRPGRGRHLKVHHNRRPEADEPRIPSLV